MSETGRTMQRPLAAECDLGVTARRSGDAVTVFESAKVGKVTRSVSPLLLLAMFAFGWPVGDGRSSATAQQPERLLPRAGERDDEDLFRLGGQSIFGGSERLPQATEEGRLSLPPISAATTATDEIGNGSLPQSYTAAMDRRVEPLAERVEERPGEWAWTGKEFVAADTFSHPLYFEDVMLERHGHERFPRLQPFVSGARFFATIPMLPYLATVRPACDIEYKVGHFRSGDRVYPYVQRPPYVRNAVIVEAAAIAGASIGLP